MIPMGSLCESPPILGGGGMETPPFSPYPEPPPFPFSPPRLPPAPGVSQPYRTPNVSLTCCVSMMGSAAGRRAAPLLSCTWDGPPSSCSPWDASMGRSASSSDWLPVTPPPLMTQKKGAELREGKSHVKAGAAPRVVIRARKPRPPPSDQSQRAAPALPATPLPPLMKTKGAGLAKGAGLRLKWAGLRPPSIKLRMWAWLRDKGAWPRDKEAWLQHKGAGLATQWAELRPPQVWLCLFGARR